MMEFDLDYWWINTICVNRKKQTLGDFGEQRPFLWLSSLLAYISHIICFGIPDSLVPIMGEGDVVFIAYFYRLKNDLKKTEGLKKAITLRSRKYTEKKPSKMPIKRLDALPFISASREMMLCLRPLNASFYYSCFDTDSSNGFWTSIRLTASTADDLWCRVYLKNQATAATSHSQKPLPCYNYSMCSKTCMSKKLFLKSVATLFI